MFLNFPDALHGKQFRTNLQKIHGINFRSDHHILINYLQHALAANHTVPAAKKRRLMIKEAAILKSKNIFVSKSTLLTKV